MDKHTWVQTIVQLNPNYNTLEPDRPQHGHTAVYVIVQQYSSVNFVSLRFHSRKEKFGASFKNVIISILFLRP